MKRSLGVRGYAATVLACVLFSGAAPAMAQSITAQDRRAEVIMSGSVRDLSGAAGPRATMVIRPESGGLDHLIDTAPDGTFVISRVTPGRYVVIASAPGFASASLSVEVPSAESVSLTLSPAPIVEEISVVSASRQEELRASLNTRVDVITRSRREEEAGQETVGEILRELPGVVTRRGSETAGVAGEQIQGIDSRQVLVLLDGH